MKKTICTITLAILCLFLSAQKSQAQYCSYGLAFGISAVWQSGTAVYFYSSTELDYCAGLYYDPATYGRFSEGNFATENVRLLADGYTEGYSYIIPAEIFAAYGFPINFEYYNTDTIHYVIEYYQVYTCFYGCGYYWWDPWGYGFSEGIGGPNWYGYGGAGYWSSRRRRLGNTWATIQYFAPAPTPTPTPVPTAAPTPTPTPTPQVTITEVGFKNDHKIKKLSDGTTIDPNDDAPSTLRVGPMNKSYDPSYGVVEEEVSLIKAVNSAGVCLIGTAANAARIKSTIISNLFTAGNLRVFPNACDNITVPPHAAAVVGQTVPAFMDAGQSYLVSVTMQNNGSNTWTQAEAYRLGSQNPQDNMIWGLNRVELPASVPQGGQVTFTFYVTAPSSGGTYNFQWRMVKEFVEWFGDSTPNIVIDVFAGPTCDPYLEQQCWNSGGEWDPTTCRCYGIECGNRRICLPQ